MAEKIKPNLPPEEVKIKLSICNECQGKVRAAVEHMMTTKSKNEFSKEVMKYNLNVKSQSLIEYQRENMKPCKCPS